MNLKANIQELLNDSFIDDCKNVGAGYSPILNELKTLNSNIVTDNVMKLLTETEDKDKNIFDPKWKLSNIDISLLRTNKFKEIEIIYLDMFLNDRYQSFVADLSKLTPEDLKKIY